MSNLELYANNQHEYWDRQPFEDYVAMRLHDANVINQWIQEAGEAHRWDEQMNELRLQGYLTGQNTTYDKDMY